jgi:hypothetical protein
VPAQRIKGQEVSVLLVRDNALEDTITDIQSLDIDHMLEVISKGYLGEPTERKDEIYKGVKFKLELHIHTQDVFKLEQAIINRAKRITPDTQINITGTFSFPNGDTPSMLLSDCKFGAIPHKVSSRGDYVQITLEGEVSDLTVQFS